RGPSPGRRSAHRGLRANALAREEQPAEALFAVVLVTAMPPAGAVVVSISRLLRRWRRRRGHEPVLHLHHRLELAEDQENAFAGIALLQVHAVALVGLHHPRALRAQQRIACSWRRLGVRWLVRRDGHGSLTAEHPV